MRPHEPFQRDDLLALAEFLDRGMVFPMRDIHGGLHRHGLIADYSNVIGMRHDCDNVIEPAVHMAAWEAARGYRSTYYILHTSPYWQDKTLLRQSLEQIAEHGHEIGIHNDAITVHLETGRDPADVLHEAIDELRGYGHRITSTVAHGNARCRIDNYVNDELFEECHRPAYGPITRLGITPHRLAEFGLDFDANWISRGDYLSDSGGHWSQPFHDVAERWPARGQLHMLVHPDWWPQAFVTEKAAA